jgi:hypothetical protein
VKFGQFMTIWQPRCDPKEAYFDKIGIVFQEEDANSKFQSYTFLLDL